MLWSSGSRPSRCLEAGPKRACYALAALLVAAAMSAACVTAPDPEGVFALPEELSDWAQGIGDWRRGHPEYADYVITAGFGGPSSTEQGARRAAIQDAYRQLGYGPQRRFLEPLDDKTIQKVRGSRYFWYSSVYVAVDRPRGDVRAQLAGHLVDLQARQPRLTRQRRTLTATGWPTLVAGAVSAVASGVLYVLGKRAWDAYNDAETTPEALEFRRQAEARSQVLFSTAIAAGVALPLGTVLLLVRPDPRELEFQIRAAKETLDLSETEAVR